jgi:GNAT superfamily N-acetyltransferase
MPLSAHPFRFAPKLAPNDKPITLHEINAEEARQNPSLFRNLWACYAQAVDRHWRPGDPEHTYPDKTVDEYLAEIGANTPTQRVSYIERNMVKPASEGRTKFFYCEQGGRVVGVASLTDWTKHARSEYHNLGIQVSRLYVLPGYDRLGLGSRLLKAVENHAFEKGVRRLYLEATKPTEAFYIKQGYHDAPPDDPHIDTSGSTIVGRLLFKDLERAVEPEKLQFARGR